MRKAALRRMPEKWAGKKEIGLSRTYPCLAEGRKIL